MCSTGDEVKGFCLSSEMQLRSPQNESRQGFSEFGKAEPWQNWEAFILSIFFKQALCLQVPNCGTMSFYSSQTGKRTTSLSAGKILLLFPFSLVQFSSSVVSDSLRPHESQHTSPPCPSPTPGVHSDSCPSSRWCHPAISSSVAPFSSCPRSLPLGSFKLLFSFVVV